MVPEGVLKCTQFSMQDVEYEWTLENFEPEALDHQINSEKSCKHIGGSYHLFTMGGSLSLISIGTIPMELKMTLVADIHDNQSQLLAEVSIQCVCNNNLLCLSFKRCSTLTQSGYGYVLALSSNVIVVQCRLTFLDHPFFSTAGEVLSTDCSSYLKDLALDWKNVYDSSTLSDVTVRIGKEVFKAHKVILAARSPVFRMMLENECVESRTNIITLPDSDSHMFHSFLDYLYTGKIENKRLNAAMSLYKLADVYNVESLRKNCVEIILSQLDSRVAGELDGCVCKILKMAHQHSDEILKDKVIEFIAQHFLEIGSKGDWKDFLISDPQLASEVFLILTSNYQQLLKKV